MKTHFLLAIIVIGLTLNVSGQKPSMELSFTAADKEFYVPLDSIFIVNLTQGGDTTLFAPDTVLVLDYITSINDNDALGENTLSVSQNYPNPFNGKTAFNLYLPEKENITITARNIIGRELVHYENNLNRGNHSFAFYGGNESYYLLTVTGKQTSQTIKMLNAGSEAINGEKCKLVYTSSNGNVSGVKSQNTKNNFVFNSGDTLQYSGYATTLDGIAGNAVINDVPLTNMSYEFAILKGLRCPGTPYVEDIEHTVYNTVQIGNQCWMAENIKTRTYQNGAIIPNVTDPDEWKFLLSGAYVWYDNDLAWKEPYGALYNWFAAVDPNGLCPEGWHLPYSSEWNVLANFIGGAGAPNGQKLRTCRQDASPLGGECNTSDHPRWENTNNSVFGTDDYGFTALPAGFRLGLGQFDALGFYGAWWSSEEYDYWFSWGRSMFYDLGSFGEWYDYKTAGRSVRCLKD